MRDQEGRQKEANKGCMHGLVKRPSGEDTAVKADLNLAVRVRAAQSLTGDLKGRPRWVECVLDHLQQQQHRSGNNDHALHFIECTQNV